MFARRVLCAEYFVMNCNKKDKNMSFYIEVFFSTDHQKLYFSPEVRFVCVKYQNNFKVLITEILSKQN